MTRVEHFPLVDAVGQVVTLAFAVVVPALILYGLRRAHLSVRSASAG